MFGSSQATTTWTGACATYEVLYAVAARDGIDNESIRHDLARIATGAPDWDLAAGLAGSLGSTFRRRKHWRVETIATIQNRQAFSALISVDVRAHKDVKLVTAIAGLARDVAFRPWQVKTIRDSLSTNARKDDLLRIVTNLMKRIP
jgi:hypothetical protein